MSYEYKTLLLVVPSSSDLKFVPLIGIYSYKSYYVTLIERINLEVCVSSNSWNMTPLLTIYIKEYIHGKV